MDRESGVAPSGCVLAQVGMGPVARALASGAVGVAPLVCTNPPIQGVGMRGPILER
jgi:hypothetical protein